jgi:hypothetical protein
MGIPLMMRLRNPGYNYLFRSPYKLLQETFSHHSQEIPPESRQRLSSSKGNQIHKQTCTLYIDLILYGDSSLKGYVS